uniref:Uncharacterized protein n=2 Tax=Caenorhabditis japonica TaxID=281687 RepID=A0A8R1IPI1_CAEJA
AWYNCEVRKKPSHSEMDEDAKDAPIEDVTDPDQQVEIVDVDDTDAGADVPIEEETTQEDVEMEDIHEETSGKRDAGSRGEAGSVATRSCSRARPATGAGVGPLETGVSDKLGDEASINDPEEGDKLEDLQDIARELDEIEDEIPTVPAEQEAGEPGEQIAAEEPVEEQVRNLPQLPT